MERAQIAQFARQAARRHGREFPDYEALFRWSVEQPEAFWSEVWDFCGVIAAKKGQTVLADGDRMPGAKWFPEARLNFAENLLRRGDRGDAFVFWDERGFQRRVSYAGPCERGRARRPGARPARPSARAIAPAPTCRTSPRPGCSRLPPSRRGSCGPPARPTSARRACSSASGRSSRRCSSPPTATAGRGASTTCAIASPRSRGRFPGCAASSSCRTCARSRTSRDIPKAVLLEEWLKRHAPGEVRFVQLPFDHPVFILFTSGTTGAPKCIVHGAGGSLLQLLKMYKLHFDVRPGDRFFFYSSTNWVVWNLLLAALAAEAAAMLYDGSPFERAGNILFDYAQAERFTHFGCSAKYLDAIEKRGLAPAETHDLSALRMILSTGSPLVPESYDFVYEKVKRDVCLSSISGGTDIMGAFADANPTLPVWRGELQCRSLGMAVEVYDEEGRPVVGKKGELVCTKPFPSMPLGFWGERGEERYRAAYFERFPGIWTHGDWCELTERGTMIIYGRSDATLNPGGVRIGTAEIYRQVEKIHEVEESVAVGQLWPPDRPSDTRIVLFVRLRPGYRLDAALEEKIRRRLRENASPRHVPARIVQVADIPRTKNGKVVELAVRAVVNGMPVANTDALANPEALELFRDLPELMT
ncbi:MAG: acetoacetate--CoA ligase [Burkholderiales bacterium]|nr:acetoacetate--CoA ligase [Burkholderiales bacterium]